jgi:hypothetical protein
MHGLPNFEHYCTSELAVLLLQLSWMWPHCVVELLGLQFYPQQEKDYNYGEVLLS